jgi:hypothetical protein
MGVLNFPSNDTSPQRWNTGNTIIDALRRMFHVLA